MFGNGSRRRVLRAGGVAAAVGLSGCLGLLGDEETPSDDEDDEEGTDEDESTASLPVEPAAYYTFEGDGDEIDDRTGNGHGGRLRETTRTAARSGQALAVGRGTYATVGSAERLNPGDGPYTASLWFRSASVPSDNYNGRQGLFVKRRRSEAERFHFVLHEDTVQLDVHDGGTGGRVRSGDGFVDGEWHHAVGVRDAETLTLYVDGQRRAESEPQIGDVSPASPIYLGAQPEYPRPLYFEGAIDDVAVFDAALSADDVQQLYESQRAP